MTADSPPPPMATSRMAAGALFVDDAGRPLLVKPTYKDGWDIPGGYVEPGESPRAACIREVHEELGLTITANRLLVIDWAPAPHEGDKLLFIFDGGTLTREQVDAVRLAPDELERAEHVARGELGTRLPARLERRLLAALDACQEGTHTYLEHGAAVGAGAAG
ncbi:MAG: NUDIX domain-containing protein [Angustibacter sp.]